MADNNYVIKGYVKSQAEIDAIENPQEGWVVIVEEPFDRYVVGTEILYTEKFGWGLNSLTTPLQFRAWVADNFYDKRFIKKNYVPKTEEGRVKVTDEDEESDFLGNKITTGAGLNKKINKDSSGKQILHLFGNSMFALKAFIGHCDLEFNPKNQSYNKYKLNFVKDSGNIGVNPDGTISLTKHVYLIFANFGFEFPGYATNYEGLKVTIGAKVGDTVFDEFSYVLDSSVSDTTIEYTVAELPIEDGTTKFNLVLSTENPNEPGRESDLTSCIMHARMYIVGPAE